MALPNFNVYVDNDTVFTLPALTNTITGLVENGATVELTILDVNDSPVGGPSWPQTMTNINSQGDYQVVLDKILGIIEGTRYKAQMVVSGVGDAKWVIPFKASVREE